MPQAKSINRPVRILLESASWIVLAAFALNLDLYFIVLGDLLFGFNDFAIGRMLFGMFAGLLVFLFFGFHIRILLNENHLRAAVVWIVVFFILAASTIPVCRALRKYEQDSRYSRSVN